MRQTIVLRHEFVEYIPSALEDRTVYVSIPFATAVHKCVCGCGNQVVTPLSPTDWQLTFDGETISLDPSIGNWSFPCQSHYFIRRDRVKWAGKWSPEEIEMGRAQDRLRKQQQYRPMPASDVAVQPPSVQEPSDGIWQRIKKRWF